MKGEFLGDTKGNRDLKTNRSDGESNGGGGESHAVKNDVKDFCGPTKGNKDLPPDRSSNVPGGFGGGSLKAGGANAGRKGSSGF